MKYFVPLILKFILRIGHVDICLSISKLFQLLRRFSDRWRDVSLKFTAINIIPCEEQTVAYTFIQCRYPKRVRLVSNGLKRKNNDPFHKRFSLPSIPQTDRLMFPCLFCRNSKEQSLKLIPQILNKKEFVAIRLWRNLNLKVPYLGTERAQPWK